MSGTITLMEDPCIPRLFGSFFFGDCPQWSVLVFQVSFLILSVTEPNTPFLSCPPYVNCHRVLCRKGCSAYALDIFLVETPGGGATPACRSVNAK